MKDDRCEGGSHYGCDCTDTELPDANRALADRAEKAEVERDRLRAAGRALATCAFNLKQRDHLTDAERRSLADSQEAWDAALDAATGEGTVDSEHYERITGVASVASYHQDSQHIATLTDERDEARAERDRLLAGLRSMLTLYGGECADCDALGDDPLEHSSWCRVRLALDAATGEEADS